MMSDTGVPLVSVRIDDKRCTYCLECVSVCPNTALSFYKGCFTHYPDKCSNCECCEMACENEAIRIMVEQ